MYRPADFIGVRELRRTMKQVLADQDVRVIGNKWNVRGFIVPVSMYPTWDASSKRKAYLQALANLKRVVESLTDSGL